MAALRVACPPRLLSAAAPFEYRARGGATGPPGSQLDWLSLDGEWGPPQKSPLPPRGSTPNVVPT